MKTITQSDNRTYITLGGNGKKCYQFVKDENGVVWCKSNHITLWKRLTVASPEMKRRYASATN
jgi:hypothetical protein